jgi:hypothetical protein
LEAPAPGLPIESKRVSSEVHDPARLKARVAPVPLPAHSTPPLKLSNSTVKVPLHASANSSAERTNGVGGAGVGGVGQPMGSRSNVFEFGATSSPSTQYVAEALSAVVG